MTSEGRSLSSTEGTSMSGDSHNEDRDMKCRCNVFLSTPCTAPATQEDGLCDQCRLVEQPEGPNRHEGNGGWEHFHAR